MNFITFDDCPTTKAMIQYLKDKDWQAGACIHTAMSFGLDCSRQGKDYRVVIARCMNFQTNKPYLHCWTEDTETNCAYSFSQVHIDNAVGIYDINDLRKDLKAQVIYALTPKQVEQWWHNQTCATIGKGVMSRLPKRYLRLVIDL